MRPSISTHTLCGLFLEPSAVSLDRQCSIERGLRRCESGQSAGIYLTLVRWWPGYMSAPHTYVTDRLCVVISGIWWCNSGDDFDPASCVPVPAGSYVRRVAGTSHYDGVIRGRSDPAIIAICGMGPVGYKLVDPSKPGWRAV
jgi:hypothetical protein